MHVYLSRSGVTDTSGLYSRPVNISDLAHSATDAGVRFLRSMAKTGQPIGTSVGSVVSKQHYGRVRGRSEGGKLPVKNRSRHLRGETCETSVTCSTRPVHDSSMSRVSRASRFSRPSRAPRLRGWKELDDNGAIHSFRRRTDFDHFCEGIEGGLIEEQASG